MPTFYARWQDLPAAAWRWPHFKPGEIASPDDDSLLVDEELFAIYPDQLVELASLCLE